MSKNRSVKINYAIPGEALNKKDFKKMIKEAEIGEFHSLATLKNEFAKWKGKHSS